MDDQKVLVAGAGKSGMAAAKLLLSLGGEVVLYDSNPGLDKNKLKERFGQDYGSLGRTVKTWAGRCGTSHY